MVDPRARREFALDVVRTLKAAGHQALWAGGCVRDLLLGHEPDDYDVATDAPPERVISLFRRTVPVGASFGVVQVLGPRIASYVEVATFRSDLAYVDGRRPEGVVFGSAELDAARRDFTINGMFLDPISMKVIDYVGGRLDLEARILRAIGDPAARFAEDKLRLLRAVRFAARFDLSIDRATRDAIAAMGQQVEVVARERVSQELRKMLLDASRGRAMRLALDLGLMSPILPESAPLRELDRDPSALAAWSDALRVLDFVGPKPSLALATAALLHAMTESIENLTIPIAQGNSNQLHTDIASVSAICRGLRYRNTEVERVSWLVSHRCELLDARRKSRSSRKRLLASEGIQELIDLHRAIALAREESLEHVTYCEDYLRDQPEGPIDPPPILTGDDLRGHGLTPGPRFKQILEAVRDAQLEGMLQCKEDALRWVDERGDIEPDSVLHRR